MRVGIIGGGIAGLAAGCSLLRAGAQNVALYEREPLLCARSSGLNAAIYRPLELELARTTLVARSAVLLDDLMGSRAAWLRATSLLLVAQDMRCLGPLIAAAERFQLAIQTLDKQQLSARALLLKDGEAQYALDVPGAGVLDIHAIAGALTRSFRAGGGTIQTSTCVSRVRERSGRVAALILGTGEEFPCDTVVLACGAWARELAQTCGVSAPLTPLRRHLTLLGPGVPQSAATIWDIEREFYFRPESGGILASPGDEDPSPNADYTSDPYALEVLFEKARKVAPGLARMSVRRFWACLRTFAPDRLPVIGADSRVSGLFWLAGLGGFGMSAGVAAGEVLARAVLRQEELGDEAFSPARFHHDSHRT